jgi:hypothetical protein
MLTKAAARKIQAKELSPGLRRAFHLEPDEEVSITIAKGRRRKGSEPKDPWPEIKGTLSSEEADDMLRAIHESRRGKSDAPGIDVP